MRNSEGTKIISIIRDQTKKLGKAVKGNLSMPRAGTKKPGYESPYRQESSTNSTLNNSYFSTRDARSVRGYSASRAFNQSINPSNTTNPKAEEIKKIALLDDLSSDYSIIKENPKKRQSEFSNETSSLRDALNELEIIAPINRNDAYISGCDRSVKSDIDFQDIKWANKIIQALKAEKVALKNELDDYKYGFDFLINKHKILLKKIDEEGTCYTRIAVLEYELCEERKLNSKLRTRNFKLRDQLFRLMQILQQESVELDAQECEEEKLISQLATENDVLRSVLGISQATTENFGQMLKSLREEEEDFFEQDALGSKEVSSGQLSSSRKVCAPTNPTEHSGLHTNSCEHLNAMQDAGPLKHIADRSETRETQPHAEEVMSNERQEQKIDLYENLPSLESTKEDTNPHNAPSPHVTELTRKFLLSDHGDEENESGVSAAASQESNQKDDKFFAFDLQNAADFGSDLPRLRARSTDYPISFLIFEINVKAGHEPKINEASISVNEYKMETFLQDDVACFQIIKEALFLKPDSIYFLAIVTKQHRLCIFRFAKEEDQNKLILEFESPLINEGLPTICNHKSHHIPLLLSQSITNPAHNTFQIELKSSCNIPVEEVHIEWINGTLILILRLKSMQYYFYRGFWEFSSSSSSGGGYPHHFSRVVEHIPLFSFENNLQMEVESEKGLRRTIYKSLHDSGKKCLFVNLNNRPFWIFPTNGQVYIHRSDKLLGSVDFVCDFRIPGCEYGFLSIQNKIIKLLYLCPASKMQHYAPICHTQIKMRSDIKRFINYVSAQKSYFYALVTASSINDDYEKYELYSFTSNKLDPVEAFKFAANHQVLCLKLVSLRVGNIIKHLIAASSFYSSSETNTVKNTIYLFEIDEHEDGALKLITQFDFNEDVVSELFSLEGILFLCAGNQIFYRELVLQENGTYISKPFAVKFNNKLMIVSTSSREEFVVCCDIRQSIALFQWDGKNLNQLAEDSARLEALSSYIFDVGSIRILVADRNKNMIIFNFIKTKTRSYIERTAEFHYGGHINMFSKMLVTPFDIPKAETLLTHFTTNTGALGFLKTLSNEDYDQLVLLERFISRELPHYCGLNPRDYRTYKSEYYIEKLLRKKEAYDPKTRGEERFLDGDIISSFIFMTYTLQKKIAKKISSTREKLLKLILDAIGSYRFI